MDENGVPNFRKTEGALVVAPSHLIQAANFRYLKLPLQFFKVHLTSRASKLSLILGGRIVNHFNEPEMVIELSIS